MSNKLTINQFKSLKAGDSIVATDNTGYSGGSNKLEIGKTYIVDRIITNANVLNNFVYVQGQRYGYWFNRFALPASVAAKRQTVLTPAVARAAVVAVAAAKAKGPVRDAKGRFTTPKPVAKIGTSKRTPATVIRNGALYGVKRKRGVVIARLRKPAHEDYLVFSEHEGRPFLARKSQVSLATKDEVATYLQAADK